MDFVKNFSQTAQIVVGGAVLYLFFSFLDWQAVGPYGANEWHGFFGVLSGLLVIALLAWELARAMKMNISIGQFSPGLVSLAVAILLLIFTIGAFLSKSDFRHWPSYFGLVLSFVIAFFAFRRSKEEGVELKMPTSGASPGGGTSGGSPGGDGGASV